MMAIHGGIDNIAESLRPYAGVAGTAHEIVRAYAGVNGVARLVYSRAILPPAYQQVEYIEATGTQYINSGVSPVTNSTKMEFQAQYANKNVRYTSGTDTGSSASQRFFIYVDTDSKFKYGFSGSTGTITASDTNRHTFILDAVAKKAWVDTTSVSVSSGTLTTRPIYICARNRNGTANEFCNCKLFSYKLYENGDIVHDYYPCYRKSDSEPGLYDIITDTFLTNAGSGTFGIGPKFEEQL